MKFKIFFDTKPLLQKGGGFVQIYLHVLECKFY